MDDDEDDEALARGWRWPAHQAGAASRHHMQVHVRGASTPILITFKGCGWETRARTLQARRLDGRCAAAARAGRTLKVVVVVVGGGGGADVFWLVGTLDHALCRNRRWVLLLRARGCEDGAVTVNGRMAWDRMPGSDGSYVPGAESDILCGRCVHDSFARSRERCAILARAVECGFGRPEGSTVERASRRHRALWAAVQALSELRVHANAVRRDQASESHVRTLDRLRRMLLACWRGPQGQLTPWLTHRRPRAS
ncbi:hypothetical protein BC628DRAFT_461452 [Trametes gibbosa]|nr:hypothetical protein BC628DRAFT_461452 [Trametes gibbosa]